MWTNGFSVGQWDDRPRSKDGCCGEVFTGWRERCARKSCAFCKLSRICTRHFVAKSMSMMETPEVSSLEPWSWLKLIEVEVRRWRSSVDSCVAAWHAGDCGAAKMIAAPCTDLSDVYRWIKDLCHLCRSKWPCEVLQRGKVPRARGSSAEITVPEFAKGSTWSMHGLHHGNSMVVWDDQHWPTT